MTSLEAYVLACHRADPPAAPDYRVVCTLTGKDAIDAAREVKAICRKWSQRREPVEERAA